MNMRLPTSQPKRQPLNQVRPPVIHHEHSPWPQRYGVLIGVVGIHILAGAALLAMKLSATEAVDPPVLTVQWVPTQEITPQKPVEKPKEPPPKKPVVEPVQKPVVMPQAKPVDAPVIQAPAAAVAAAEAPQVPPAPPTPPAPALVVQAPPPPVDSTLKPQVDCTRSPLPTYPEASRKLSEEGTVMLRIQVDEQGRPLVVEVTKGSGYPRLDRVARETVLSSWVCPLRQGRQAVNGRWNLPMVFTLPPL